MVGGRRVPAGHMDVPCVTTMWNSNLFDSTRGGNPPPRCRCFNLHFALGPGPGRPFGPRTRAFCYTMCVVPNLGSRHTLYPLLLVLLCLDGLHIGEGWTAALMGDVRFACCALSRGAAIDPAAIPFGLDVADSWASPLACPRRRIQFGPPCRRREESSPVP